jgi:hypothetical protein
MIAAQVAAVLAKIQLGDNRETDAAGVVLAEWVDTIGDLDYQDAIEAVRMHRKSSTVYLQAAHIRENVRLIVSRRERAARVAGPRAITSNVITLDRSEFDRLTQVAIDNARATKAST